MAVNTPAIPSLTRLILVRHGETDWNRTRTIQGHRDIPLNEVGLAQARAVASRLGAEPIRCVCASLDTPYKCWTHPVVVQPGCPRLARKSRSNSSIDRTLPASASAKPWRYMGGTQ